MLKKIVFALTFVLLCAIAGSQFVYEEKYEAPIYEEFCDDITFDPVEREAQLRKELGDEGYEAMLNGKPNDMIWFDLETGEISYMEVPDLGLDHTDGSIPPGLEIADLPEVPDALSEQTVTYSEREKRLLEWSAKNGDKPIVGDGGKTAKLYVLKSEEQLAELEAMPNLETLRIDLSNTDLVLSSPTLRTIEFSGEFLSGDAIEIDLSGCTSLTEVALYPNKTPRKLKLPDSVGELKMGRGLVAYADYLSTLPNLKKLTPSEVFDLSVLNGFETLETLVIFGGTASNYWDLSVLTNEHITSLQTDSQETVNSFVGLAGLRSMYISDRRISDISRIIEYAPDLETLVVKVPDQYIGDTQALWRGDPVDASNVELLDGLETSIPIEQFKALVAGGTTIRIWGDPNR